MKEYAALARPVTVVALAVFMVGLCSGCNALGGGGGDGGNGDGDGGGDGADGQCTVAADCSEDEICQDEQCVPWPPECTTDADCTTVGDFCRDGVCVIG